MTDTRIAYGAMCTWWGPIQSIGRHPEAGLPCCPHCFGMLFEMEDEQTFLDAAILYEEDGHPGYVDMVKWIRGRRCYRSLDLAIAAYQQETETRH